MQGIKRPLGEKNKGKPKFVSYQRLILISGSWVEQRCWGACPSMLIVASDPKPDAVLI
jgi:hypothetical protein